MFKKNFIKLCIDKGEAPTSVCQKIGLSNAAYSSWDDNTVPRKTTLKRISDYFGVPVDYLLTGENNVGNLNNVTGNYNVVGNHNSDVRVNTASSEGLTEQEFELLNLFRALSEIDKAKALLYIAELKRKD